MVKLIDSFCRAVTALMAVDNMLGASHDIWNVNTDYEYHEEQRVDPAETRQAV
mgnify:CR=1 FL=1